MSDERLEKCRYRKLCGGCQLQHLSYARQLEEKQKRMEKLLGQFHEVLPIIGMEDPLHYRNKVNASFGYAEHRVICGNYVPSTHEIVEVPGCMINDEKANEIIQTVKKLSVRLKISIFDEDALKGGLRHVMVRCSNLNEYMVVLVTGTETLYKGEQFVRELVKAHPEITTVVQNVNRRHTSMVLGNHNNVLYGKGYITDQLMGCHFRISAASFYQINKRQTAVLYRTALNMAHFTGSETVIDAYCGTGTIGIIASREVRNVIGVEINEQAVRDAKRNARENGAENISFYADDAGSFMRRMAKEKKKTDAVIMDPPRSGADKKFLDALCILKPEKIVYISCGPDSLKQNLHYLIKNGYQVEFIQPVDMFPYTEHVETVVLLSKGNISSKKVHVDFPLKDIDMSGIKTGATYDEIKSYVKKNYDLTVSSLNIAQIKEKYGIKERESYNHSKKQEPKQPKCTEEKEEAILDALKYYNMV